MDERITGRRRVLVARSLHPEYRDVLRTYAKNSGLQVEEIPYSPSGTLDQKALQSALRDDVAAVVTQSPNFFGAVEPIPELAEIVRSAAALLVVALTEGVSVVALRPPLEPHLCTIQSQSFRLPPTYCA